jgi:hypothetical protein
MIRTRSAAFAQSVVRFSEKSRPSSDGETRRRIRLVALQFERVALDHGGHNFG